MLILEWEQLETDLLLGSSIPVQVFGIIYYDIAVTFIPPTYIPLEPSICSCQSLEEMANKIDSSLEQNCATNEDCTGVRCELNIFGNTYHVETILLSCEDPPAMDVVVENEENSPLYAAKFNHSGLYRIEISGLPLWLHATAIHNDDYSIEVEVSYL